MKYTLTDPNGNTMLSVESTPVKSEERFEEAPILIGIMTFAVAMFSLPIIQSVKDKHFLKKIENTIKSNPECYALVSKRMVDYMKRIEEINKALPKLYSDIKRDPIISEKFKFDIFPECSRGISASMNNVSNNSIAKNFKKIKKYGKSTLEQLSNPYLKQPIIMWMDSWDLASLTEKHATTFDKAASGVDIAGSLISSISSELGYDKAANIASSVGKNGSATLSAVGKVINDKDDESPLTRLYDILTSFNDKFSDNKTVAKLYASDADKTSNYVDFELNVGIVFTYNELHGPLKPVMDLIIGKSK